MVAITTMSQASHDSESSRIHFHRPPVIETLHGMFFKTGSGFSSAFQGVLWNELFRSSFPKLEERARLDEVSEFFADEPPFTLPGTGAKFQVLSTPEPPRLWAVSGDDSRVVQIQNNAFLSNWLRKPGDSEYVVYADRRKQYEEAAMQVSEFLARHELGGMQPTSWTITYVNQIPLEKLSDAPREAIGMLDFLGTKDHDSPLARADQLATNASFPLPGEIGRLHLNLVSGFQRGSQPESFLRMELTARGNLSDEDQTIERALSLIDVGHEAIVSGFVGLISKRSQEEWGLQE